MYADDTVMIASSEEQLPCVIVVDSEEKGLVSNSSKSCTMVFIKSPTVTKCNTVLNGKFLEQVESFT